MIQLRKSSRNISNCFYPIQWWALVFTGLWNDFIEIPIYLVTGSSANSSEVVHIPQSKLIIKRCDISGVLVRLNLVPQFGLFCGRRWGVSHVASSRRFVVGSVELRVTESQKAKENWRSKLIRPSYDSQDHVNKVGRKHCCWLILPILFKRALLFYTRFAHQLEHCHCHFIGVYLWFRAPFRIFLNIRTLSWIRSFRILDRKCDNKSLAITL